jgi:acetyltransferase-like isoleucine patch superfamily enzyme
MEKLRNAQYEFEVGSNHVARLGLLSPYRLIVHLPPKARIEIGRFSLGMAYKLQLNYGPDDELLFSCGAFCQANQDALIVLGGEHANSRFWNVTFGGLNKSFGQFLTPEAVSLSTTLRAEPVRLGNNVVLSARSTILSGVELHDGCVVGAGAVVTRDCAAFGIYAGVPARQIKSRFDEKAASVFRSLRLDRIRAHHLPELPVLVQEVQSGELTVEEFQARVSYLERLPTVHVQGAMTQNCGVSLQSVLGFALDDEMITHPVANARLTQYFNQVWEQGEKMTWAPDVFHGLGLS